MTKTLKLFDNSRIKDSRRCLRYFYFRHERDWVGEGVAPPLAFGAAWHEAMDFVWGHANSDLSDEELVLKAGERFILEFESQGMPSFHDWGLEQEEQFAPRTPGTALEMLHAYIALRRPQIRAMRVMGIERPFAVPIYPNRADILYVGRRDKDVEMDDGTIGSFEHKTSTEYKKDGGFKYSFLDSFSPNSQIDGYLHSLHMEYGEKAKAVWVDAALVHKRERHFKVLSIRRMTEMLDAWLAETHHYIERILDELAGLETYRRAMGKGIAKRYLPFFPKNTDSCFQYGRKCPYHDLCTSYPNPETLEEPPNGYRVERWEPFHELSLEQIGLEDENG